ncbi:ATP-binding protein [Nostocoides jenkinsii]|uniref:Putative two-component system sensor kinase n=1 Tax=Nostocoides jenkinsii Ben 74 TaxID=1193518 RepID=A0A077M7C2_9MICO|nr:ATP-binding protein [Tetrasphaera jenkinsii]CCI52429.1 putative two-component system sensor kinase [Tetrasphaera jenkinsii Ben 74]
MPTPYAAAPAAAPPRLVRPLAGRQVAGVCAGLAEHLGVPVRVIRLIMLVLLAMGPGVVAYVLLWALTPEVEATPGKPGAPGEQRSLFDGPMLVIAGAVVAFVGVAWLAQRSGVDLRLGVLLPLLVIAVGTVIGLSQLDAARRTRWLAGSGWQTAARLGLGVIVTAGGILALVTRDAPISQTWDIIVAVIVVLIGAGLLVAPWGVRVLAELRAEQAARARADERADMAAHLHDSVLQTLALIQRQSGDSARVATLARAQERELRAWLYGGGAAEASNLSGALAEVIGEVEAAHGIPVDLVMTGDREMDDGTQALVRAVREALANAVRHGRPPVSVYVEAGPTGVEAFIRDHGPGLDMEVIPEDRLGVRESIIGRMTRHGGAASSRRLDPGTEWSLTLPPPQGVTP